MDGDGTSRCSLHGRVPIRFGPGLHWIDKADDDGFHCADFYHPDCWPASGSGRLLRRCHFDFGHFQFGRAFRNTSTTATTLALSANGSARLDGFTRNQSPL